MKENGDVTVIMEVDREDMGDTNNIYTVTFAATEPANGCTEPPCEALTNVTLRIQVILLWMGDLSSCNELGYGLHECILTSLRRILMTICQR